MSKFKIKNRKKLLLGVAYALLLGHFLFSTFIATLGPAYTFNYQDFNKACAVFDARNPGISCIISCPSLTTLPSYGPALSQKGFPTTLYYGANDPCYGTAYAAPTDDFAAALTVNVLYVAVITTLFGYLWRKSGKDHKHTARRNNR